MVTSQTSYHTKSPGRQSSRYEFVSIATADLEHDEETFLRLRARIEESDESEQIRANSIDYVDTFLERIIPELEWRRKRAKRTPARFRGAFQSRYESMKDLAQELKARLSIAEYLDRYVPWAFLTPQGDRLRGRCPFPNHQDDTASFVVYPDDHAWCFGCNQGGDLFRVVALIEGLPDFRDQLRFVTDLVEPQSQEISS